MFENILNQINKINKENSTSILKGIQSLMILGNSIFKSLEIQREIEEGKNKYVGKVGDLIRRVTANGENKEWLITDLDLNTLIPTIVAVGGDEDVLGGQILIGKNTLFGLIDKWSMKIKCGV